MHLKIEEKEMEETRKVITTKMKEQDWLNLAEVQRWYKEKRGLDLKDSSVIKMLLADKASELKGK